MRNRETLLVYSTEVYRMQNMFTMQNEKVRIKIIKVYLNRSGYSFFSRVANVGSTTVRLELWFVHFACIPFGNIRAVSRLIFFALI